MRRKKKLLLILPASSLFLGSLLYMYLGTPKEAVHLLIKHEVANQNVVEATNFSAPWCSGNVFYDRYCVITPWPREEGTTTTAKVTLCTQGTEEYLDHVTELCARWTGPISVAVYVPPGSQGAPFETIQFLNDCNACVRQWVDWHVFFDGAPFPDHIGNSTYPICPLQPKREKRTRNGTYPINVGRNIARMMSRTHFVFSLDIELYPSEGVLARFTRMLNQSSTTQAPSSRQVWVLPVFEVWSKYKAPKTKDSLRQMFHKKQAISFHKYRCNTCHQIPNLTQWINVSATTDAARSDGGNQSLQDTPLHVWMTVHRSKQLRLQYWEPFFIGTLDEPQFDPRLSWEGKQNKMQLMYEMCLMKYDFQILDDAFLVHAPGVNMYSAEKDRFRWPHIIENDRTMKQIKTELDKKYGRRRECEE